MCIVDSGNLVSSFEKKRRELALPEKYKKLLNPIDSEYLSSLGELENMLIKSLIKIVTGYYGLMDRPDFLYELCQID